MRTSKILYFVFAVVFSAAAEAESIQLGVYSGNVGYFAKIGKEHQLTLNAIVMNQEVAHKIGKLNFEKLGEVKNCEVDGLQQAIGYTIFKIKSCK